MSAANLIKMNNFCNTSCMQDRNLINSKEIDSV